MATGDLVTVRGAYATLQASASVADGAVSAGSVTDIGTALAATVEDYPLLDFKLTQSVGTPVTPGTVDVYRKASDGTNPAQTPTSTITHQYVGSFTLAATAATKYYYLYGVPNVDQNDTYYCRNKSGATLTFLLAGRGRSVNVAA